MPGSGRGIVQWLIEYRAIVLLAVVVALALLFVPYFRTELNITQMLTQLSIDGVVSVGITILMVAGGIDLGVGSTLALGGMVFTLFQELGVPVAALLGMLTGVLVGAVNAFVVTKMRVNFFIATLASMVAGRGLVIMLCDSKTIYGEVPGFNWMGTYKVGILEFPALAFFVIAIIAHFVMSQMRLGRYWYAIGGNRDAAMRAGLPVKRLFALAFVVMGLCSGIAGVLLASRISAGSPNVGRDTGLIAISATVIGGTSLFGGVGHIPGAVAGSLLLGIIRNSLNLLGVKPYWQWVVQGMILVSVVVIDVYVTRRRRTA